MSMTVLLRPHRVRVRPNPWTLSTSPCSSSMSHHSDIPSQIGRRTRPADPERRTRSLPFDSRRLSDTTSQRSPHRTFNKIRMTDLSPSASTPPPHPRRGTLLRCRIIVLDTGHKLDFRLRRVVIQLLRIHPSRHRQLHLIRQHLQQQRRLGPRGFLPRLLLQLHPNLLSHASIGHSRSTPIHGLLGPVTIRYAAVILASVFGLNRSLTIVSSMPPIHPCLIKSTPTSWPLLRYVEHLSM